MSINQIAPQVAQVAQVAQQEVAQQEEPVYKYDSDDEELSYDCIVCKKHLYITEMAMCEYRELCAECSVTNSCGCDYCVCVANREDEEDEEDEEVRHKSQNYFNELAEKVMKGEITAEQASALFKEWR
jgi:hypothetical protein